MPIEMRLSRIIISEINENQVVFLKEVEGERSFPIMIGMFEAMSIDRRVKELPRARPLTHDLIVNAIESLGGELDSVLISDLKEHTYYATLRVKRDGEIIEIDSRPSDAIAVAVTCDPALPIFISEQILEDALSADQGQ
ncbi:MAG: bifunctional nuclease family protein [Pirellulaceae bacterium]